jgi:Stage II sporulation protein E (SpoIIE)/Phosphoserine phosphatase RsbU, N-terminal domain
VSTDADYRSAYASAFADYLADPAEPALRAAYELGRTAVGEQLSVLDLAAIHHDVLLSALVQCSGEPELQRVSAAAGDFFLESLSAFEMVQRGYREARETALLELRQTAMVRQLSRFLADTSLALHAGESLEEMLQLVAEQARELIGAECCLASVAIDDGSRAAIEAVSLSDARAKAAERNAKVSLSKVSSLLDAPAAPARMTEADLARRPTAAILARLTGTDRPLRGRLVASLTGLDGRELGTIQLFDKLHGDFTDIDEALLVHLAEMASAAVERAELYAQRRHAETVQGANLPVRLPEFQGVEIAARRVAGTRVGGDWYDVVSLPNGRVGIAVGDVAGRGIAAVAMTARVRTAFRAYAGGDPPEAVVERVDALLQTLDSTHSSTMIYAVVDPARHDVRIVRAGHPSPLLVAPGGEVRYLDEGLSAPLGVVVEAGREHARMPLEPGSVLLVYAGPLRAAADWEAAFAELQTSDDVAASDIETLCDRVLAQIGRDDRGDDVTVVALRCGRSRTGPGHGDAAARLTSAASPPRSAAD